MQDRLVGIGEIHHSLASGERGVRPLAASPPAGYVDAGAAVPRRRPKSHVAVSAPARWWAVTYRSLIQWAPGRKFTSVDGNWKGYLDPIAFFRFGKEKVFQEMRIALFFQRNLVLIHSCTYFIWKWLSTFSISKIFLFSWAVLSLGQPASPYHRCTNLT